MGVFILLALFLWFVFIVWLTPKVLKCISPSKKKVILTPVVFIMLFIAPVADEIIGGFQFGSLCSKGSVIKLDEASIKGKVVKLILLDNGIIVNFPISIREFDWNYQDIKNGQTIVRYKTYRAQGGWLSRTGVFLQGNPPFAFNGTCGGVDIGKLFDRLNVSVQYK